MKTKFAIFLTLIVAVATIGYHINPEEPLEYAPRIGRNSMSCTVTKFQLSGVDTTQQIAPLFENLGTHSFKVSTKNKLAQQFFNQGLRLTYAFNHAEAHRSFMEAARLDPSLAMAYWGQAYALGPNINDPLPENERKTVCN